MPRDGINKSSLNALEIDHPNEARFRHGNDRRFAMDGCIGDEASADEVSERERKRESSNRSRSVSAGGRRRRSSYRVIDCARALLIAYEGAQYRAHHGKYPHLSCTQQDGYFRAGPCEWGLYRCPPFFSLCRVLTWPRCHFTRRAPKRSTSFLIRRAFSSTIRDCW